MGDWIRRIIKRETKSLCGKEQRITNRKGQAGLPGIRMAAAILIFGSLAFGTQVFGEWSQAAEISVQYGYDNTVKGGRYIPLDIAVTNRKQSVLEGILKIKSMESDGTVYHYAYDLKLEPLEENTGRYHIPIGVGADRLFVVFEDGQGTELAGCSVILNVSRDVPEMFIGILTDDLDGLEYLDGVGISYSTLRTRTFVLDPEEFPREEVGLSLLDVLVVNNFKLRDLSEEQTAAIMDWVHSGGVLILGTGQRVGDTLGRFAPELLDDSYGAPHGRMVDLGEGFALDNPADGLMELVCVDIPLHGGNVILSSDGFGLITVAAKEQGLIGVVSFDLTDIRQFCQSRPAYVDYLFTLLLGETRINRLADVVYSGNSEKFWSVQSLINTGNVEKLPKLPLYTAVVAVYLLILGPGMYLFLKNRDLQIFYRRGVMMLSAVFTVIIYLMGMTTRFKTVFYTYASIQDVTADFVTDTTYVNVQNPYNSPYKAELDPSCSVMPITRSYQSASVNNTYFTGEEPYQIAIERGEDRLNIRGQNISAFTPRYFKLEKRQDNTEKIGITGTVDYFEGKLTGKITNEFPFPLEDATLMLYGNMVHLGRLEPGETRDLSRLRLLRFPLDHSYAVAERIIGADILRKTDISNKSYLLAVERCNMLKFYFDNYMNNYSADARLIAFSTEEEDGIFLREPDAEIYGHRMITSLVEVNASRDRLLYRSVLIKTPRVISGSYYAQSNSMGGTEPLTLEYYMGTEIDVESLTFEPVSKEFLTEGSGSYIDAFTGSIYFYNYESGNYDRMELNGEIMTLEQLRPYLSPGNTLIARFVYDGTGSYNAIQLPMPMVAGRER